jgi:hypothetical protein
MSTREEQKDRKQASKGRPRQAQQPDDEDRDVTRERSHADPMADEYPSICRGID